MFNTSLAIWTLLLSWLGLKLSRLVYNVFLHPLRDYPGPVAAAATTRWKTYIEVFRQESMTDALVRLHEQYGLYAERLSSQCSCCHRRHPSRGTQ